MQSKMQLQTLQNMATRLHNLPFIAHGQLALSVDALIIQSGITKVVTHKALMAQTHTKWSIEIEKAQKMFQEANVEYFEFDGVVGGVKHVFNGKLWAP